MTTELSLSGVLPAALYSAVLERLSSFSEAGSSFALDEEVFARSGAAVDGADTLGNSAGQYLRVKALRLKSEGGGTARWSIQVNQRPEPPRTAPRALQYGVVEFALEDGSDPRVLASAMGFSQPVFKTVQRGVRFRRGQVVVDVFQLFESSTSSTPLDPSSHIVQTSIRFSSSPSSSRNQPPGQPPQQQAQGGVSSQEARDAALAAIEGVAGLLKGLVDLARVD
ncbi:hypothetical protein JCM8097_002776 [Rhodosporidiobolus ruineniae]